MGKRADFTVPVSRGLAERAGFICSFPKCNAPTIGPSAESSIASAKTGMACHIYAASDGPAARRIRPEMTIAELSAIENGIWMCYRHGKLIDADECTYTPNLLQEWRRQAERRAALRHALGRELTLKDLATEALAAHTVELATPQLVLEIADIVRNSGMESIWGGTSALAARDAAIEIARNALTHGAATRVNVQVTAHSLQLSDDGAPFSLSDLEAATSPRGGVRALTQLRSNAPGVILSYVRQDSRNVFTLASTNALDELLASHPCSTSVFGGFASVEAAMDFIEERPECGTIFLRPRYGTLSYSDLYNLKSALIGRGLTDRDVALVMEPHSEGIREFLAEEMPNVRLIESGPRSLVN